MFRACAPVGSRIGAHAELIRENQTGLLFDAGSVAQLAQALDQLIRDPARRETFGRAAAASIVERGMTVESMTASHLELYEAILHPV